MIELNAFNESTSKTAYDDWSSYITCTACTSDSHPASFPTQLLKLYLLSCVIQPPYYLFDAKPCQFQWIEVQDSCQTVLIYTLAIPLMMTIDLQMFYINRLSCYQIDLISRSSSSYLYQDQSVLCSTAFFKLSTSIEWNLIRWISSGISGSKVPGPAALPCAYFCFIWYKNCFICI